MEKEKPMPEFAKLEPSDAEGVARMSALATEIVREHFDPIIGKAQNDHMIAKFQTPEAIREQLEGGSDYRFVVADGREVGFLAFFPRGGALYLSKFYLRKEARGRGLGRAMLGFAVRRAEEAGLEAVELNVNRRNPALEIYRAMGFEIARAEKKEIGGGFVMDDYVCRLDLAKRRARAERPG